MTRTSDERPAERKEMAQRLAPHVEEEWESAFIIELRLRDVPGDALGAALAEVESHCAESGEPAADAFGDPAAYARSLDLPAQPEGRWAVVEVFGPTASQCGGLLVLGWGGSGVVSAWRAGEAASSADLTFGMVAMVVALGAAIVLFYRHSSTTLRLLVERPVLSVVALTGLTAALGMGAVLLDGVLVTLPAWPVAAAGALALAAGTVWSVAQARMGTLDDPIVSPIPGGTDGEAAQGGAGRRTRALSAALSWIVPAFAAASLGLTWLLLGR